VARLLALILVAGCLTVAQANSRAPGTGHTGAESADDPGCRACLSQAASLFAAGNTIGAADLLSGWQGRCPHNAQLHLLLSTVLLRLGGHQEEALAAAGKATALAPGSVAAHLQYGLLLAAADDNMRAASELEHTIELDPGNYEAWSSLARVYSKLHDDTKAQECADKAAELEPSLRCARLRMLKNLVHAGKLPEAKLELKRLLSASSPAPEFMEELAREAMSIGAWDEAAQAGSKVCQAYPKAAEPLKLTALAQLNNHSYNDCLGTCGRLLALEPHSTWALAVMGRAHLKLGNPGAAEQEIKAALTGTPDLPMAHLAAGELEFGRGNYAQARAEIMQALDSDPGLADTAEVSYLTGQALERAGDREESIAYFKRSLSRGLSGEQAEAARQAIERLKAGATSNR